jgi:ankyrin repeat protein
MARQTTPGGFIALSALSVLLLAGVGLLLWPWHYATVQASNGDIRLCVLGVAYRHFSGTGSLASQLRVLADLPPRIGDTSYVVELHPLDPTSNVHLRWNLLYAKAASWANVDLRIARCAIEDLAERLRTVPGQPGVFVILSESEAGPLEESPGTGSYRVRPGWQGNPAVRDYLGRRGLMGLGAAQAESVREPWAQLDAAALRRAGWTPLQWHACIGDAQETERLLASGVPVNDANLAGYTALHLAAQWGNDAVVQLLLKKEAKLNVTGGAEWTPLTLASANGHRTTAELLLLVGASPAVQDEQGRTALHHAVRAGSAGCAEVLLDHGAMPNVRDSEGLTPLHWAVLCRNEPIVGLLVARGADPSVPDELGNTPLALAQEFGPATLVARLKVAGPAH